jgi:N-acetylglucosaminyl-diphospho-decaprenol L-rhamnosyltransferase
VGKELHASSGYRVPEATIGLQAFLSHPIAGGGLGHLVRGVFVSTFGVTDVGPIYHVFYVTLLVNGGILALVAVLGALAPALRGSARQLTPQSLAFQCLLFGALAAAAFAGPTDGHWELGVLPALVLLAGRPQPVAESTARRHASFDGAGGPPSPPARRSLPVSTGRHRPSSPGADGRGQDARRPRARAIVVTYNSLEQIGGCVEALLESGVEVTVVDNASSDGTCALVRRRFPEIRVLANRTNRGFAHAVNQALAEVHTDTVLLVNPDCVVSPGAVSGLTDYLASKPDVGVVGPRLRDHHGLVANSAHPFETALTVLATRFGGGLVPRTLRAALMSPGRRRTHAACRDGVSPVAVDWLSGACLAVRTTLLRSLGGLDAGYFMYYEDEELCLQAWRAGARVVYLPSVEAVHTGGASSHDPVQVWPHLYRSLLRFQARHRPRTYALVRVSILVRALLGVGLGAPRDAVALVTRRPARRSLAWLRIGQVAVRGTQATPSQGS